MNLQILDIDFCICKMPLECGFDMNSRSFVFFARTDRECSLVCERACAPQNALKVDEDWRAIRICAELDFTLVGILSKISGALAQNKIPIFAVSTYDTDYVLLKFEYLELAVEILKNIGYAFVD